MRLAVMPAAFGLGISVLIAGEAFQGLGAQRLAYPPTRRGDVVDNLHGASVADPYRWLEDTDSADAAAWAAAQEAVTSAFLAGTTGRGLIRRRIAALSNFTAAGVPWWEAGRLFYEMRRGTDEQPALFVQNGFGAPPRVVLDPRQLSRTGSTAVRNFSVSPDGRWIAYALAEGGSDAAETRVRNLTTGRVSGDSVRGVIGTVCWTRDALGFFYVASTRHSSTGSTAAAAIQKQLAYHRLGAPQARDRIIREWSDNYRWGYCMLSEDGRRAIAVAERGADSEVYTMDLVDPARPATDASLELRLAGGHAYTPLGTVANILYVATDRDAPRRRIVSMDLTDSSSTLRPVVPEAPDVIEEAALTADRIAIHYLVDVKSRLRLFTLEGQPAGEVTLPGVGSIGWGLSARSSSSDLFYSFTTFLTPRTVYRYDTRRGVSTAFRPPRPPIETAAYETRQVFYRSKDGTRVPMFITAKKGLVLDGENPTLLTAYGGYGSTVTPAFQPDVLLWLEMGGVYALANIRGGGEYGEEWHAAGMLDRKQTSFDDFIAAAEHLIGERVTSSRRLAIYGHSNGGLLIGAVLTQRPDLFGVAVANAGHYDMLRYHRFTVGAGWIPEYGSPDDPAAFRYLRAYSPLHNVRADSCYPSTLLLTADHDDRVVPSHAYKFAAALQAAQTCDRPILLRVARAASHSYASKDTRIAELADMWAFIAAGTGVRGIERRPVK